MSDLPDKKRPLRLIVSALSTLVMLLFIFKYDLPLRIRAELGNASAQNEMAWKYMGGPSSITYDKDMALHYFLKSAENGNRKSIQYIWRLYPNNPKESYFWKYISACLDDPQAPANVVVSSEDIIKACPQALWRKTESKDAELSVELREEVEKNAEAWIKAHAIEPHPPYSYIVF